MLKPKFTDKKANKFAEAIIFFLQDHLGHMAWRQSTEGRYRPGKTVVDVVGRTRVMKGTYIPATKTGLGDVTAVIKGKYVSIEIKIGADKWRPNQVKFAAEVTKAGGGYILVRTWDHFILQIQKFL